MRKSHDGLLGGLGRACYRHRKTTLLAWVAAVAVLVTLWMRFGAAADNSFTGSDPGQAVLSQHFPRQSGDTLTLAIRSDAPVTSPAVRGRVAAAIAPMAKAPHITSVISPYAIPGHVSRDGHIAFASVQLSVQGSAIPASEANALMADAARASGHGVTFSLGGDVVDTAETPYGGSADGIGIGAAMIVLLIAFGSFLAMGLPVATALFGIGGGLSLIALLGHLFPAPSFAAIIAAMIGLGVGVDYALFILTRFRAQMHDGEAPEDAAVTAMRTAGASVLTAGTTVVIGLMGLLILRQALLSGVAIAAGATVAMTVLGALTLLPALLGFTGTRLAKPSLLRGLRGLRGIIPPVSGLPRRRAARVPATRTTVRYEEPEEKAARPGSGRTAPAGQPAPQPGPRTAVQPAGLHPAERWAAVIQRRPWVAAGAATLLIAVLAAPAATMRLSMPDESAQARGTMGYASYATMAQGFGPGFDAPLIVAAELPCPRPRLSTTAPASCPAHATMTGVASALAATPGVAAVAPPAFSADGRAAMLIAYPTTGSQDAATNALATRITGTVLPKATAGSGVRAYLTGPNEGNAAFTNLIDSRLPWLIAVVVALAMGLLLFVFRSVVIAVKAAVMNLLSVCASYGVLVAVTQWGWAGRVFGFPEKIPVTTWVPVFLFVILFGLSMDYEVFLLSRVREAWLATGSNSVAVARGLATTARVISAAAAIMVLVFVSFVSTPDVGVKQIGLGLAVAVGIDATVIRLVLVPAVMELLGQANWWAPRWLARTGTDGPAGREEPAGKVLMG